MCQRTAVRAVMLVCAAAFFASFALAGCGGDDGADGAGATPEPATATVESPAGEYDHPQEGTITLSADGTGTGEGVEFTWVAEGEKVVLTTDDGDSVEATLRDGDLVFPPGAYSCCEDTEAIFERQ